MVLQHKTIPALIDDIRNVLNQDQISVSALNRKLSPQLLRHHARWLKDKPYTRVCLYEDEEFELLLICWQPMAKTAVHNHNEQSCWVFCFDTDFEEMIYCQEGQQVLEVKHLQQGDITFLKEKNGCHSLQNISNEPAMTLHLYNKPIRTCQVVGRHSDHDCMGWSELQYDFKVSLQAADLI